MPDGLRRTAANYSRSNGSCCFRLATGSRTSLVSLDRRTPIRTRRMARWIFRRACPAARLGCAKKLTVSSGPRYGWFGRRSAQANQLAARPHSIALKSNRQSARGLCSVRSCHSRRRIRRSPRYVAMYRLSGSWAPTPFSGLEFLYRGKSAKWSAFTRR